MSDTRTYDGALPNEGRRRHDNDFANFASLPSLASLRGDGIRFQGHAELGLYGYALAIGGGDGETVHGVLKTITKPPPYKPATVTLKSFTMPRADYAKLVTTIDKLADGYPGDKGMCLDGLYIAFERIRPFGIISRSGNGACSDHYEKISEVMRSAARQYAGLDVNKNWMPNNLDELQK